MRMEWSKVELVVVETGLVVLEMKLMIHFLVVQMFGFLAPVAFVIVPLVDFHFRRCVDLRVYFGCDRLIHLIPFPVALDLAPELVLELLL